MTNFINKNLIFFPAFIGLAICLNPYTLSGFYFDDIFNSLFSADIQYFNDQFIRIIKVELKKWFSYGRFFPVTIISGSIIWELSDNILTYRLIHMTLLISVSSKYQQIVNYGDPYIVVYLQYWGMAIILAFIYWKLPIRKLSSFYRLLILIGPVFISSLTVATNYEKIKLKNKDFYDPRYLMELFVQKTFVNFESEKNILLVDSSGNPPTP